MHFLREQFYPPDHNTNNAKNYEYRNKIKMLQIKK